MATNNPLSPSANLEWKHIDDGRWRKNGSQISESGQNGMLVINDKVKAEGPHRVGRWLKSGIPLYRDADNKLYLWEAVSGKKIAGFLQTQKEIAPYLSDLAAYGPKFYDEIPVGIQTAGEIYPKYLPVTVPEDQIPARFGVSPL